MKIKLFYLLMFIILATTQTYAQLAPYLNWFVSYDGTGKSNDFVNDIKFDDSRNCYLAGRSSGNEGSQALLIAKYSIDGDLIRTIEYVSAPNSSNVAESITIDANQNVYVIGNATFGQSTYTAILQKYSASGEMLWEKNYQSSSVFFGEGTKIAVDAECNVIAGFHNAVANIIKYSTNGDSLWSVSISDTNNSWYYINNIILDSNSNIYVIYTRSFFDGGDVPWEEIHLLKILKTGDIVWDNIVEIESPRRMLFDLDSNLVIASHGDAKILKYSLSGEKIWEYNSNGLLTDISINSNNDIIMCGYNSVIGGFDYMIKKISADGMEIWDESFNSDENINDFATSISIDNEDNLFIIGNNSDTFTQGISYTLKYDTFGELKWKFKFDMPHSKFEHPSGCILDDSNNVIVAGDYTDSTNGSNYFIMKINQKLGTGITNNDKIPNEYYLSQNYPNPFNPSTLIKYQIPANAKSEMSNVKLVVYDILGNEVATLVNEKQAAGNYEVNFDASNLSSGVYIYKLQSGSFISSKTMLLLK